MIAAGVNAKALSTFMGHATISITLDLCGPLMGGWEAEAEALLDDYVVAQRQSAEKRAPPSRRRSDWRINWRTDHPRWLG
jgi:hypothetical protein